MGMVGWGDVPAKTRAACFGRDVTRPYRDYYNGPSYDQALQLDQK